jgi:AraC-like DNA-binding protein
MVQGLLLVMLECIDKEKNETDSDRLNKIYQYINDHIHNKISIASLAREVNLSESRFKNFFREVTGFSPADYVQRKKIDCDEASAGRSIHLHHRAGL